MSLSADSAYQNLQAKATLALIKQNLKNDGGIYAIMHNETKKNLYR